MDIEQAKKKSLTKRGMNHSHPLPTPTRLYSQFRVSDQTTQQSPTNLQNVAEAFMFFS